MKTFTGQQVIDGFNAARLRKLPLTADMVQEMVYPTAEDFMAAVHPAQPDDRVPGVELKKGDVLILHKRQHTLTVGKEYPITDIRNDDVDFGERVWVMDDNNAPYWVRTKFYKNYFHLKQPAPQPELKARQEVWCIQRCHGLAEVGDKLHIEAADDQVAQVINSLGVRGFFGIIKSDPRYWRNYFSLTPPAAQPPAKEEWVPTYGETVECWGRDKWYTATYACKHPLLPLTHLAISLYQVYQPQTIRKPAPPKTAPTDAQLQVIRENWDTLMATLPACVGDMIKGETQQNLLRLIDKLKNA